MLINARRGVVLTAIVLLVAGVLVYGLLGASLPRRSGTVEFDALTAPVSIELDRHAIPRIRASSTTNAFLAQGFMHAQERFFQMDLARRAAAGELASLFGERALEADRERRTFRFRDRAERLATRLPSHLRSGLESYVDGVNAGLADLGARPPEYWLLGQKPEPWSVVDSLLVFFSIYTMLSNNDSFEKPQGVMQATLPEELFTFLTPSTSRFDRPLLALDDTDPSGGYRPRPIPSSMSVDLREEFAAPTGIVSPPLTGAASNQWALAGEKTADGRALVANDPHLVLRLPNTFYRVELEWPDGGARGISLPGVPGVLIGATERIAWGATVSNADQSDFVVVEVDPSNPGRYATPDGFRAFETYTEEIEVAGSPDPVEFEVISTRWGPIVDHDWLGRPLALRATWLDDDGANLAILDLPEAGTADEAVELFGRWHGPSLNWLIADVEGDIAWTVNGPIPQRYGHDGSVPMSWANGTSGWSGWQATPSEIERNNGWLFTANNRTLPEQHPTDLGRFWMRPFRAHRIAQLLATADKFDERQSLAMQLDTRTEAFDFFRDIILDIVEEDSADILLAVARQAVATWNGNADADQTGFRILQLYYLELQDKILAPLLAPAYEADPSFVYRWPLADEPLRRILEERPSHLLPAEWTNWDEMLRAYLRDLLERVADDVARPGIEAPWGEVNRLALEHPFSSLPLLGNWLRLRAEAMPGSMSSLRVAAPRYGAVIRMSVSPAAQDHGILQMPAGQSGHFLSKNFGDLHADWVNGNPTPFLAGETQTQIELVPAGGH